VAFWYTSVVRVSESGVQFVKRIASVLVLRSAVAPSKVAAAGAVSVSVALPAQNPKGESPKFCWCAEAP
jgi:hypothetical protein